MSSQLYRLGTYIYAYRLSVSLAECEFLHRVHNRNILWSGGDLWAVTKDRNLAENDTRNEIESTLPFVRST